MLIVRKFNRDTTRVRFTGAKSLTKLARLTWDCRKSESICDQCLRTKLIIAVAVIEKISRSSNYSYKYDPEHREDACPRNVRTLLSALQNSFLLDIVEPDPYESVLFSVRYTSAIQLHGVSSTIPLYISHSSYRI